MASLNANLDDGESISWEFNVSQIAEITVDSSVQPYDIDVEEKHRGQPDSAYTRIDELSTVYGGAKTVSDVGEQTLIPSDLEGRIRVTITNGAGERQYAVLSVNSVNPSPLYRELHQGDTTTLPNAVANSYIIAGELPAVPVTGQLGFDDNRRILQWWDGDNTEWPTYVDNNDVETSEDTVSNTTDETEIFRFDVNSGSLVEARLFILRIFGKYNTASSNDEFTYRVYAGDSGFDPTAGGGTNITTVATVQENVNDGPWQIKTTMTVFSEGSNGTLAAHSEGAFNNNKNDDHVDPITIDTTSADDFVGTVEWNNAKAGNSVTQVQAYLQQSA